MSVEVLEKVNLEIAGGRLAVPDIAVVDREFAATNPTRYPCPAVLAAVIVSPSTHPQSSDSDHLEGQARRTACELTEAIRTR